MTKKEIKYLDEFWSFAIKERDDFTCQLCGKTERLNSHHIISRSRRSTRWLIKNGVCLCQGCHKFKLHVDPIYYTHHLANLLNIDLEDLVELSRSLNKESFGNVKEKLVNTCKELKLKNTLKEKL